MTRIAAGLVLAAGIGTVALRQNAGESNEVRIELVADQTGPVPPSVPLDTLAGAPAAAGDAFATGAELAPTAPATAAASTAAEGADLSRRAAVRMDAPAAQPLAPTPLPASRVGQGAAASAAADRAVASAKARQPSPAALGASMPPVVSARDESRSVAAGGAAGGRAGTPPAGTTLADTASRLRRLESNLRLQSVVVTGVTAANQPERAALPAIRTDSLAVGGLGAAGRASLAGSCYALDLAPPAAVARGEMPLPRTMRIRLADIQNITAFVPGQDAAASAQAAGMQRRAPARAAQAQPPAPALAPPMEALETVQWEIAGRDSVVARRLVGLDVIVLRLAITGDEVSGTAVAQAATTPPVPVAGRRISCDGSF